MEKGVPPGWRHAVYQSALFDEGALDGYQSAGSSMCFDTGSRRFEHGAGIDEHRRAAADLGPIGGGIEGRRSMSANGCRFPPESVSRPWLSNGSRVTVG